jgi:hypothetical protein
LLNDQEPLISIIVNVDIDQILRAYSVKNDESQLLFKVNISKIVEKELEISSFEFYMQHKFILITTLENQIFFLSPEFEIMEI